MSLKVKAAIRTVGFLGAIIGVSFLTATGLSFVERELGAEALKQGLLFGLGAGAVYFIVSLTYSIFLSRAKLDEEMSAIAKRMAENMVEHMHELNEKNIKGTTRSESVYETKKDSGKKWTMHLGDSVEICKGIESDSVHYSIFSPPFASRGAYVSG